ncbi:MAG: class I SAM-dependent methyltransferase [Oscillospiraceae bacterium]|nr:class I SAM-dependent methyltransferase [Oscillospiraceae bacterium]
MKGNVWDFYAPAYNVFMSGSKRAYQEMNERIRTVIKNKRVLELACGTGLISKAVADASRSYIATDFSEQMLAQAQRGKRPEQLMFSKADAADLPFKDNSFDVVIISNALHIVPDPERVLSECKRVLARGGVLIAPNFIHQEASHWQQIWTQALIRAGIAFESSWDEESYAKFLTSHGWKVRRKQVLKATLPMMYAECIRRNR